ncbi:hypothetical protein JKG68_07395 [Microvirga aerilata]|uniref:Uncharacterized protein n=1 Tax=Microvirga aerilata TaxID=670292 RepID=A0A937CWK0_9HYPH|nr:hypothetical protein [Microvirga aerilata]MBL0403783.1 hypothetical protein [Microvirga aerilata]
MSGDKEVLPEPVMEWMENLMMFIVTGEGENGLVSTTCETAVAALQQARRLADEGVRNVLIDAGGTEYTLVNFKYLFVEPDPVGT